MLHQLSIGLTGMRAAQIGLDVTGNNLANANTPGYRRQMPMLAERAATPWANLQLGNGVDIQRVRQARAELIGRQLFNNLSEAAQLEAQYDVSSQVEGRLNPASGSISDQFDSFHATLESLAATPFDSSLRATTVQSGLSLTRQVNRVAADLISLERTIDGRVRDAVEQVNTLAEQIAQLNDQIRRQQHSYQEPNTLIDQRNALAQELSKLVNVEVDEHNQQVFMGGMVIGTSTPQKVEYDGENLVIAETDVALQVGGLIGGLQAASQQILPLARQRLDDFAFGIAATTDELHSQGVGLDGHLSSLRSTRQVEDPTAPLAESETPFSLAAGNLYVGVKDLNSGERTLTAVAFDPETQSLEDLAAGLNAVGGVSSFVDDAGRLVVRADSGFGFDFTGRPSSVPDTSGLTGASSPTLSGRYMGENRSVDFEFLGSGDIGVTAGLQVEVKDSATGESLGVFDIGQNYAPGDEIELPDGVSFALSVGNVVSGETFAADLISTADETGSVVRLGLNTLFTGSNAGDLTIHPDLLEDPARLAASLNGEPGDSGNLTAMLGRRFESVQPQSGETIDDLLFTATGAIGHETRALETELEGVSLVGEQLFLERESVEGVDPNEEVVEMLKYQRAFEASARFVSAVNQTLEELMNMLR